MYLGTNLLRQTPIFVWKYGYRNECGLTVCLDILHTYVIVAEKTSGRIRSNEAIGHLGFQLVDSVLDSYAIDK